jgi:hypothetical protein
MSERRTTFPPTDGGKSGGLTQVPDRELLQLLRAVEQGRIDRVTEETLADIGLGHLGEHTRMLHRLNDSGVRAAILACLAERRVQPPPAELVWSGPNPGDFRDPAVAVSDLLDSAERAVLVVGYDLAWGKRIFEPMMRRLLAHSVDVQVFVDVERNLPDPRPDDRAAWPEAACRAFLERNWPTLGDRKPRFFVVDEGLRHEARCIVVDEREALVTSADLTEMGETTTLEVGVLSKDQDLATQLSAQWRALVESGHARQINLAG